MMNIKSLDESFDLANQRAARLTSALPRVVRASYGADSGRIIIELENGIHLTFRPQDAQGLEGVNPDDLMDIEISPSGFGLYFPKVDADLYLPALLDGRLGSRKWMAQTLGRTGGQQSSPVKAAAARSNGRLGGRPKKVRTVEPAA